LDSRSGASRGKHIDTEPPAATASPVTLVGMPGFVRFLLLPLHPAGLLLLAVLALGFALASVAGLFGLPAELLLLSWLFKYGYVLLEHTAHGGREPPVLSVEMINPVSEQRPLLQLAIVLLSALALRAVSRLLGPAPALLLDVLALAALPASIATLGAGERWWQALNPVTLWRVMRALHWRYLGIVLVALAWSSALAGLWLAATPIWFVTTLMALAWLSLCALIGGSLFEERAALGLEAVHAPERIEARAQRALEQTRTAFVDRVYGQARGGNLADAWADIERELAASGHAIGCYQWLLERLARLDDPRLANRLAQQWIHQALGRDNGRVVALARERLTADPGFRPRSAAETLRVATLARLAGEPRIAERLLERFTEYFPESPL